jgi:hypothetical protein
MPDVKIIKNITNIQEIEEMISKCPMGVFAK